MSSSIGFPCSFAPSTTKRTSTTTLHRTENNIMEFEIIHSDGPKITYSNFWDKPDEGKFIVSINARTCRILLPSSLEHYIPEMATASEVVISRGSWPAMGQKDGFEFMFEDGS